MKSKIALIIGFLIISIILGGIVVAEDSDKIISQYVSSVLNGSVSDNELKDAPIAFPGNKDKFKDLGNVALKKLDGYLDLKGQPGIVTSDEKLMTYNEFLNKYNCADRLTFIDGNRMVYVRKTKHVEYDSPKIGKVKNAKVIEVWDAESGQYIGGMVLKDSE